MAHSLGNLWLYTILLSVNLCSYFLAALCLCNLPRSLLSQWRDGSGLICSLEGPVFVNLSGLLAYWSSDCLLFSYTYLAIEQC